MQPSLHATHYSPLTTHTIYFLLLVGGCGESGCERLAFISGRVPSAEGTARRCHLASLGQRRAAGLRPALASRCASGGETLLLPGASGMSFCRRIGDLFPLTPLINAYSRVYFKAQASGNVLWGLADNLLLAACYLLLTAYYFLPPRRAATYSGGR